MIEIYQGETLLVELTVVDEAGDAKDLSGATVGMFYKVPGGKIYEKACTVAGNIVSAKFEPDETAVLFGTHTLEVKIKDSLDDVDMVYTETMEVSKSLDPDFGVV